MLERSPMLLEGLLESVAEGLRSNAAKLGVDLWVFTAPELGWAVGDATRLKQILFNLAGNAIKFSSNLAGRRGKVLVSMEWVGDEGDEVSFRIRIKDNGIGMSREVQSRVFQPFVQGEDHTTRRYGGTGLGLVITRRLVELMDGALRVESQEGQGTEFIVDLSLPRARDKQVVMEHDLSGVHVLLVCTDELVNQVVSRYLGYVGASIHCGGPDELYHRVGNGEFAPEETVVVIDAPGGKETVAPAIAKLRRANPAKLLRVLICCRGNHRGARIQGEGIASVDLNTLRRATLVNAVAVLVGRDSLEVIADDWDEVKGVAPRTPEQARAVGLVALVVDDNPINRKTISQQMNMLGYAVDTAENGEEGLALWRAGDYPIVLTDCHMPKMDGYGLSRAIRAEEGEARRTPIVAITADAVKGANEKCFAAGMDDYLSKPMQLRDLHAMLEKWLPWVGNGGLPGAPGTGPAQAQGPSEPVDSQALQRLLGLEDPLELRDFYQEFVDTSAEVVDEIYRSHAEGDLPGLGDQAHKLKSSANTLGAFALGECCLALEQAGKGNDPLGVEEHLKELRPLYARVEGWIGVFLSTHSQ